MVDMASGWHGVQSSILPAVYHVAQTLPYSQLVCCLQRVVVSRSLWSACTIVMQTRHHVQAQDELIC
jgi:hypothetical protein